MLKLAPEMLGVAGDVAPFLSGRFGVDPLVGGDLALDIVLDVRL